jgi:hypothetical protein
MAILQILVGVFNAVQNDRGEAPMIVCEVLIKVDGRDM